MDALTLLADARAAGLAAKRDGDRLTITGPAHLGDLATALLECKADVLAALTAEAARLPDGAIPLWRWDALHPLPGIVPTAPPVDLTPERIAAEVDAAQSAYDALVIGARIREQPVPAVRSHVTPIKDRPEALGSTILAAGECLGWPAVALRSGERLADGEVPWRAFLAKAPVDRLHDAGRLLGVELPPAAALERTAE